MIKILAIVCAVELVGLGVGGYFLKQQIEKTGAMQVSIDALTAANKAKSDATRSRAQTEQAVRQMAPADKRSWLLGKPPNPDR